MGSWMTSAGRMATQILSKPGGGLVVFLVVITVSMSFIAPHFVTVGNWMNLLNQSVFLMLLAIGMTFALMGGGIDLSVGAIAALAGGIVAWLVAEAGLSLGVAISVAAVCGVVLGGLNGLIVAYFSIPGFVTTLATMTLLRGVLYVWTEGEPIVGYATDAFRGIGGLTRFAGGFTIPMVITATVAVVAISILRFTRVGPHLRAVGDNPEVARLSGVKVERVKIVSFMVSGFTAALAGILLAARFGTVQADMAQGMEIQALAAAILGGAALSGGKGSVIGACLGGLTLLVIQNVINILGVPPAFEMVVVGVVIIAVVSVDRIVSLSGGGRSIKVNAEAK